MKKLLTLLITLVIVICLVNLNYNHTQAEENGDEITNGWLVKYDGLKGFFDVNPYTDEQLATYGIIKEGDNFHYNFSQDLSFKYDMAAPFTFNSGPTPDTFYFNINGNLTFSYSPQSATGVSMNIFVLDDKTNLVINGNGNTLTFTSGAGAFIEQSSLSSPSKVTLNNIKLVGETAWDTNLIYNLDSLALGNGAEIKFKNTGSGNAIGAINNITGVVSAKGSVTPDGQLEVLFYDNTSHTYKTAGGSEVKYIELKGPAIPEPTPSPSKKDESCEKVIGPTWHWNNDKGICEDYGVVGTSTR